MIFYHQRKSKEEHDIVEDVHLAAQWVQENRNAFWDTWDCQGSCKWMRRRNRRPWGWRGEGMTLRTKALLLFPLFSSREDTEGFSTCLDSMDSRVNAEFGQLVSRRHVVWPVLWFNTVILYMLFHYNDISIYSYNTYWFCSILILYS